MIPIPSRFFVTSGRAVSSVSTLNAFDQALVMAGIAEANIVPVSSVLPRGVRQVERTKIERGAITFCVMARMDGEGGGKISAGIGYFLKKDGSGGYVAEGHVRGIKSDLERQLCARVKEMALLRGIEAEEPIIRAEEIDVPKGHYGSCIAALVFMQ
jgi:arginine decarboxylase